VKNLTLPKISKVPVSELVHHALSDESCGAPLEVAGDNPTIGLILYSQKNETIARYSMLKESQQLFATKYRLHLPTEEELANELNRELLAIERGNAS
jgi:hypothetical protein